MQRVWKPVTSLTVQFQNVLPSEELICLAQQLWSTLQLDFAVNCRTDAVLSIGHASGAGSAYDVWLRVGSPLGARVEARGDDAGKAIRSAFSALEQWAEAAASNASAKRQGGRRGARP